MKKIVSLSIVVSMISVLFMLTGCGDREAKQAQARQTAQDEAAKQFMRQGDGTIRKPGQSGFKSF